MGILKNVKYERFCQEVCNGKSYKDAMIAAGYKETKHLAKNSGRLLKKQQIINRISELKQELCDKYILTREQILVAMGKIIEKGADNNAIAAAHLAAKLQGMLEDTLNIKRSNDAKDISEEDLMEIIKKGEDSDRSN